MPAPFSDCSGSSLRTQGAFVAAKAIYVALLLVLLAAVDLFALGPPPQLVQYAHNSWRLQEGALRGEPTAIAQTTDGYIWIGTSNGLVRFDGVKFETWTSPSGSPPLHKVLSLSATPDGALWIGGLQTLYRLKDNRLQLIEGRSPGWILQFTVFQDHLWFYRGHTNPSFPDHLNRVCRIDGMQYRCFVKAGPVPDCEVQSMHPGNRGDLLLGCVDGLLRWKPDSGQRLPPLAIKAKYYTETHVADAIDIAPDQVLVAFARSGPSFGLQLLSSGKWSSFDLPGFHGESVTAEYLFLAPNGALWIGTIDHGIYHIVNGRVDHFGAEDGLSADSVNGFFVDREGGTWVLTPQGIDLFHPRKVVTYTTRQGMLSNEAESVLTLPDGSLAVALTGGFNFFRGTNIIPNPVVSAEKADLMRMLVDHTGQLWVGAAHGVARVVGDHLEMLTGKGVIPNSMMEDAQNTIFISGKGMVRVEGNTLVDDPQDTPKGLASFFVFHRDPNPANGFWLLGAGGDLWHYLNGQYQQVSPRKEGFDAADFLVQPGDKLWAWGTKGGAWLWHNKHWQSIQPTNGIDTGPVYSITEDRTGSFWIYSENGMFVVPESQIEQWADNPAFTLHPTLVIDPTEGAIGSFGDFGETTALTPDGQLWVAHESTLQMFDTEHLPLNPVPPPVHIQQVVADRVSFPIKSQLTLPKLTRNLQLDYTALSFVAPGKVHFRYRLDGHDTAWQDAGNRRQAFYNDLHPGSYRFHVIAANNDGVWNETGDAFDFSISPAFYQTALFRYSLVVLALALLWLSYLWRLRLATFRVEERMMERLSERERIARDLHDTILQGFQAFVLKLGVMAQHLPVDHPVRTSMEDVLSTTEDVLNRGRDKIRDLRASPLSRKNLDQQLADLCRNLQKDTPAQIRFSSVGTPQQLKAFANEDLYIVCKEALTNALLHASAKQIDVFVEFAKDRLAIRCTDNGNGFDPAILVSPVMADHWGVSGMKERAHLIGADFTLESAPGAGTTVQIKLSGKIAYAPSEYSVIKRLRHLFRRHKAFTPGQA